MIQDYFFSLFKSVVVRVVQVYTLFFWAVIGFTLACMFVKAPLVYLSFLIITLHFMLTEEVLYLNNSCRKLLEQTIDKCMPGSKNDNAFPYRLLPQHSSDENHIKFYKLATQNDLQWKMQVVVPASITAATAATTVPPAVEAPPNLMDLRIPFLL